MSRYLLNKRGGLSIDNIKLTRFKPWIQFSPQAKYVYDFQELIDVRVNIFSNTSGYIVRIWSLPVINWFLNFKRYIFSRSWSRSNYSKTRRFFLDFRLNRDNDNSRKFPCKFPFAFPLNSAQLDASRHSLFMKSASTLLYTGWSMPMEATESKRERSSNFSNRRGKMPTSDKQYLFHHWRIFQ